MSVLEFLPFVLVFTALPVALGWLFRWLDDGWLREARRES